MHSRLHAFCAAIAIAALTGCAHVGLKRQPVEVERAAIDLPSGLRYTDLFLGDGPAAAETDKVTIDYSAWLEDGTRIDSTLDRGVPLNIRLPDEAPVRGLALGIVGMRPHGRRRLVVPPDLGYGAQGVVDLIPPNATLVFEVHLIAVAPPEGEARVEGGR